MKAIGNPFVDYLNSYTTTSSDHEAVFDEFISQVANPPDPPLRLETKVERFLRERFTSPDPPSIILTGNAGDGKTYLCRQIIHAFSAQTITEWGKDTEFQIDRGSMRLYVVKDLSEMSVETGVSQLQRLNAAINDAAARERYLIAANEGRLRDLLRQASLHELEKKITQQLLHGSDQDSEALVVINLNQVATSAYVPEALTWMSLPGHWNACTGCPIVKSCPIHFNARRLRETVVAQRIALLYQLIEHIDAHVTIRDMLMHLAYTLTGGQQCTDLIQQADSGDGFRREPMVYSENVWALQADEMFQRKSVVVQHLAGFPVGKHSLFSVDDFIINGQEMPEQADRYGRIFTPDVDLGNHLFEQDRNNYLRGNTATSEDDGRQHPLLTWLPRCRRKIFFEHDEELHAIRLIPFLFLADYLNLLNGDWSTKENRRADIVLGLNRAFSQLYITEKDNLYVTAQYSRTAEQPQPLVRLKIPIQAIEFHVQQNDYKAYDRAHHTLWLQINADLGRQRLDGYKPVLWKLNLLRFEYLMRLAHGGTYKVLAEQCDLSIRNLKDQLLSFAQEPDQADTVEFFIVQDRRYKPQRLRLDPTTQKIQR